MKRMKIVTRGHINSICRVLFGSGHFSSVWSHSVYFAKFSDVEISKATAQAQSFNLISSKPYRKQVNRIQAINFVAMIREKKFKNYGILKFLFTQDYLGWKFHNASPTIFIQCQSNFMGTLAIMGEYRLLLFVAIGKVLKLLRHFKII